MATLKKNQLAQILFVLVDKTDFATQESGITAASVTGKFYGVNHGGSAAMTSGTISKAVSLVRSGLFRATLKAAETNYDYLAYRFVHVSAADQVLIFQSVDNDDSDIMSALALIQSAASDAASAATQINSRVLLNQSRISDIASFLVAMSSLDSDVYSMLSDLQSDFQSRVPKRVATDSQLSDVSSDLRSLIAAGILVNASAVSDIESALASRLSDILSAAVQANSRVLLNQSLISDVDSALTSRFSDLLSLLGTTGVQINASAMSDLRSAIAGGPAATITASDISDIASAVWANTIGARVDSRVLLNQSRISDVQSMVSDFLSDFQSRVPKRVATDSQLSDLHSDLRSLAATNASMVSDIDSVLASRLSDILSAAVQINSRVLVNQSLISDVDSALTSRFSDLLSVIGTTGVQLNASSLSDIRSAMAAVTVTLTASDISDIASAVAAAAVTLTASEISDIASAVWAHTVGTRVDSRVLVNKSVISDVQSMLSDLLSDFQSRVPKRVATDSQLSDVSSDLRSLIAAGVTINASGLSDLESALASRLSDILSGTTQINSRVLLNLSLISDVDSALTSRFSDLLSLIGTTGVQLNASSLSDLRSAITAGGGATVSASDISDIASAVWANAIGARVDSRVLVNKSTISDVQSMLSDLLSDFQSRVPKRVATDSQLSDVSSDLRSLLAAGVAINASGLSDLESTLASRLSDVLSGVQQTNSRVLVAQSTLSDITSAIVLVKAKTDALPDGIRKNTALANFPFLMVDSTDHVTPKTGLTITATRRIDGGAFGACTNAATEVSAGWYTIDLSAADLNGDTIALKFAATGADTRNVVIVTDS